MLLPAILAVKTVDIFMVRTILPYKAGPRCLVASVYYLSYVQENCQEMYVGCDFISVKEAN